MIGIIVIIWSIYVIIKGEYKLSGNYGLKGNSARGVGVLNLLLGLGLFSILIPISDPLIAGGVQILILVVVSLLAIVVFGNSFKKETKAVDEKN